MYVSVPVVVGATADVDAVPELPYAALTATGVFVSTPVNATTQTTASEAVDAPKVYVAVSLAVATFQYVRACIALAVLESGPVCTQPEGAVSTEAAPSGSVAINAKRKSPCTVPTGFSATAVSAPLFVPKDVERTAMPEGAADVPVAAISAIGATALKGFVTTASGRTMVREMLFDGAALASMDKPRTVPVARFVMSYTAELYATFPSVLPTSARSLAPEAVNVAGGVACRRIVRV
jgi:hypothetical protein